MFWCLPEAMIGFVVQIHVWCLTPLTFQRNIGLVFKEGFFGGVSTPDRLLSMRLLGQATEYGIRNVFVYVNVRGTLF